MPEAPPTRARPIPHRPGNPRKAALAAWIGSALEYYDFFIYGTAAALVFGTVFFPDSDPAAGTLLSLATFGVGYLARPVGAIVLGHLGDRVGRRKVLLFTVLLMGASTFLVGCLPSYDAIGVAAPILLVALRLLQGFSAGGEQAGANSMSLEHAPSNRRALLHQLHPRRHPRRADPRHRGLPADRRAARRPALLLGLANPVLAQRRSSSWSASTSGARVDETPVFQQEQATDDIAKVPLVVLMRDHWRSVLRVICAAVIATPSTIFTVYALSFAVDTAGLDKTPMLWVGVLANVVALGAIPAWATLSDRIGRKPVFLAGSVGSAVMMFAYLWSITTGNYALVFLTGIVMFGLVYTATSGVWPAFYGEMFPARVRLSGTALGTQIGFAIAGFAPSIAGWVTGSGEAAWLGVATLTAGFCLVNVVAVATARETYDVPTEQLGGPPSAGRAAVPAASGPRS